MKYDFCKRYTKMDLQKPLFLSDMCRICMMTSEFLKDVNIYELTPNIINMLNSFANIEIPINKCLPSIICNNCYTRLMDSMNFKNLCVESNNTLNKYLQTNVIELTDKDVSIKTEESKQNNETENCNPNIEFISVKPIVEIIEPSEELLNALGLIKVNSNEDTNIVDKSTSHNNNNKNGKKLYSCQFCDVKLFDYGVFRRHLATHGETPYSCKICGQRFSRARTLKEHAIKVHSGGRPYSCTKCTSKFGTLHDLTVHLRKHDGNSEPHACPHCPRRFSSSRQLREHSSSHTSVEKPTKKYKRSATGFGEHCCKQCNRKFRKRCDLERHVRVHSGEKPYKCSICGGRFQQAHNLTKHMVTHTGVRSYTCDICRKTFGRSDVLARHMHVHEVSKPFSCQICSRTFARQSQLANHLKKRHPKS